jgi:hypothetical protein
MDSGTVGKATASGEPVFSDSLTPAESVALESTGIRRTLRAGKRGSTSMARWIAVLVLLSGFVKLSRLSEDGRRAAPRPSARSTA